MNRIFPAVAAAILFPLLAAASDDSQAITVENVLRVMNQYRAAAGVPPLATDDRLRAAADDRMRHMEEVGYWSHESPDGMTPFVWVRMRAYDFRKVGENLAAGFDTAGLLVQAWMESPGHRANVLSPDYQDCGLSIIEGSTKGPARGSSIVALFGAKRSGVTLARN
jgi:uncharacterized protein YkwD